MVLLFDLVSFSYGQVVRIADIDFEFFGWRLDRLFCNAHVSNCLLTLGWTVALFVNVINARVAPLLPL